MVQIYLLLVLLNIVTGLVLARSGLKRSLGPWDSWFLPFEHRHTRGLVGTATFLTGFLGLIFVLPGDQIFLGDLFPSITALLGGTLLVLDYYRREPSPPAEQAVSDASESSETTELPAAKIEDFLVSNTIIICVVCLTFGLLHFFSPTVVFL